MKTIHTPGPWQRRIFTAGNGQDAPGVWSKTTGIAVAWVHGRDDSECQANARLIAASPTMLAVLQELEESAGYWSEYDVPLGIVDRIRQVIKDATGEPA